MRKLVLFDVDLTLVTTGGADRKALNQSFQEMFGIANAFDAISFAGRMDLAIVDDAFRKWKVDHSGDLEVIDRFRKAYVAALAGILADWNGGKEFPGVRVLLDSLREEGRVDVGLVTGNFRESAFLKLEHFRLGQYFVEGGFGGDSADKSEAVAIGIGRCQRVSGENYSPQDIYVVGDSPADVLAGQANGVKTVAVATGFASEEKLRGYNPSYLISDLTDSRSFIKNVLGLG